MNRIVSIIRDIDDLLIETRGHTGDSSEASGLQLTEVEHDLYESHASAEDLSFASVVEVLNFLKDELDYERIKDGSQVKVHFRPHASNVLIRPFDGKTGHVVGVDETGRPWVQFSEKEWIKAAAVLKVKSTGPSPLESNEFEYIQFRMRAIRLDPMDVQQYRFMVSKLGYQPKIATVHTKNYLFQIPGGNPDEEANEYEDPPYEELWTEEELAKEAKFVNDHSSLCGHCKKFLKSAGIVRNRHHVYDIGIMYQCPCEKSKIWTNSLRNEKKFLKSLDGEISYYHNGFCNDRFCGFTFEPISVIKNGIPVAGFKSGADRIGNKKHMTNNNILHFFDKEDKENETENITEYYTQNRNEIEKLITPE